MTVERPPPLLRNSCVCCRRCFLWSWPSLLHPTVHQPSDGHYLLLHQLSCGLCYNRVVQASPATSLHLPDTCQSCPPAPSHLLLARGHNGLQDFPGQVLRRKGTASGMPLQARRRAAWTSGGNQRTGWQKSPLPPPSACRLALPSPSQESKRKYKAGCNFQGNTVQMPFNNLFLL